METRRSRNKYSTHVSPQYYSAYSSSFRNILARNYAIQLMRRADARTDSYSVKRALEVIFGDNWYKQPYKKLLAAVKLCDKGKGAERDAMHESKQPVHAPKLRYDRYTIQDSTFMRAISKYYGKNIARELTEEALCDGAYQNGTPTADTIKYLLIIAKFIERYDKKELKQLKNAKRLSDISDSYQLAHAINRTRLARERGGILPQHIYDELCEDYARIIVAKIAGNDNPLLSVQALLSNNRTSILSEATLITQYKHTRDARIKRISKHYLCYRKCKDFAHALNELQLETVNMPPCEAYKIASGIYKAVTTIAKMDAPLSARQETARAIADNVYYRRLESRVIWATKLKVRGEK